MVPTYNKKHPVLLATECSLVPPLPSGPAPVCSCRVRNSAIALRIPREFWGDLDEEVHWQGDWWWRGTLELSELWLLRRCFVWQNGEKGTQTSSFSYSSVPREHICMWYIHILDHLLLLVYAYSSDASNSSAVEWVA